MNEKTNLMKGSMMRSILITGTGEAEVLEEAPAFMMRM